MTDTCILEILHDRFEVALLDPEHPHLLGECAEFTESNLRIGLLEGLHRALCNNDCVLHDASCLTERRETRILRVVIRDGFYVKVFPEILLLKVCFLQPDVLDGEVNEICSARKVQWNCHKIF